MQKDPEQLSDQELAERIQDAIAVLQLFNNEDCAQDVAELVDRYNRVCDTKFVNTIKRNPCNYCDDCGEKIQLGKECHYDALPQDIASANLGESATLCAKCFNFIESCRGSD